MNRRGFLTALLSAPLLVKSMGAEPFLNMLTVDTVNHVVGYNNHMDFTWLRVSITLPDGREFHDLLQQSGDHRGNPELLIRTSNETIKRALS